MFSFGGSNIDFTSSFGFELAGTPMADPKLILKLWPKGKSAVAASSCAFYTSGGSLNRMLKVLGNAAALLIAV